MSKHKSAEDKLHVDETVRPKGQPHIDRKHLSQNQLSPAPARKTNANNQYR